MSKNPHIAALIMAKNEHKRLHVTLNSIKNAVDSIVFMDTGSTDDTIEIVTTFCKKYDILLRLKETAFIDFSTSRNESLDFADTFTDIDYLLLLDVNDELKDSKILRKVCTDFLDKNNTGFLICQEWFSGKLDKYYNIRMVKAREGWRYRGCVHEWFKNTKYEDDSLAPPVARVNDIVLYQDRTQDDDKSGKRFHRDEILLLQEHKKDPTDTRTVFYLAQTYACLNRHQEAFYYYKLRSTMVGFWEEVFHSFLKCGELSQQLGHPWKESVGWYMLAFEHTERAEPLIKLAEYYKNKGKWNLAFMFIDNACKLSYPDHCILFVDKRSYDYTRWSLMGIIGYYANHFTEGKIGCQKAIETGINVQLDSNNLKFYLDKEKEILPVKQQDKPLLKNDFVNVKIAEIKKECPTLTDKQLKTRATALWKLHQQKNTTLKTTM